MVIERMARNRVKQKNNYFLVLSYKILLKNYINL